VDERQDVFTIGVLLAQLLSGNVLYATLYGPERLLEQKFTYIPGVSMAFNKVLSECLHRNILQRYNSLDALKHGLKSLPLEPKGPVYAPKPVKHVPEDENALEVLNIKTHVEWWFWLLLGVILLLLVLLLSTNFLAVISGKKEEPLHFTNIFATEDSTEAEADQIPLERNRSNSADTLRGGRRTPGATHRDDPRKNIGDRYSDYTPATSSPVRRGSPIPASFVYVEGGTFGFNRLKENLNHNVSQVGFYISSIEVTQAEWNKYMMPASVNRIGDRYPVDNVSWMNIIRYCNRRQPGRGPGALLQDFWQHCRQGELRFQRQRLPPAHRSRVGTGRQGQKPHHLQRIGRSRQSCLVPRQQRRTHQGRRRQSPQRYWHLRHERQRFRMVLGLV